ncbi:MAG: hypothetical protein P8Q36_13130 [Alphaproteobacteria bacterium]|jgi:hypothetical protein|nr:hypothetical protein [Rhodospirillaceae bacterium]MBT6205626.1 hypothetical protein [Rhodospirillaceae bacterium]MBT6511829.1 hypothetical protein [Rhodospirillaceae bacterium]MBT7613754.1 hypothetical protein [Rhodospirillaceae bacterium]MDG2481794.1 hypothetical protein [Alphaproteobacteria bacterium]
MLIHSSEPSFHARLRGTGVFDLEGACFALQRDGDGYAMVREDGRVIWSGVLDDEFQGPSGARSAPRHGTNPATLDRAPAHPLIRAFPTTVGA